MPPTEDPAATVPELCWLPATELRHLLHTRQVSPVDVVQAHLDRVGQLNDRLVAYVHVDADGALAAARIAEAELAHGQVRGPLHGVPLAYKDIYDVCGLPTTAGSRLLAGNVASADCVVAAKLRQAGAVCLGKLNTTEFASGDMHLFGEARNPWDLACTTGGSSSGPGGAVPAGLATLTLGTDTGGSVRIPASFCGVAGLRPTYGRISRRGVVPLSWSMDQPGPLARRVADLALLLESMAGPGVSDPTAEARPVPAYRAALTDDLHGVRVGLPLTAFADQCDPQVRAAVELAVRTLADLGATVVEVALPHVAFGYAAQWALSYAEAYAYHRRYFFARPRDYGASFLHKIAGAAFFTAEELVTAQRLRTAITNSFLAALRQVDALVLPTTGYPAGPVGGRYGGGDQAHLTRAVSLTGLPALSVPCGFSDTGLPFGLQVVGRAWDEPGVLRIGHAYEQATPWHRRQPPLTTQAVPAAPASAAAPAADSYGPDWILDAARVLGVTFLEAADTGPVAAGVRGVKTSLAAAREILGPDVVPPLRPAPVHTT